MLCFYKFVSPFFPVAISFTTFSLISFLADARRGEIDDCAFGDYLLFFFFFPKLLQGPIMRYTDFRAVVRRAASVKLTTEQFAQALFCFVLGLSKKVLLADNLAVAADYAFSAPENLLWMEALLATFTYTFQIYFDFSGYCDMGRAVSRMFGFDLPENFDRPYLAENIADFWRRWHRTLSQFLTRYVYIPLGGNRRGLHRTLCNTMIVFLLSGIWHGNSICFLIWGSLHGLLVCAVRLLKKPLPLPRIAKRLFTFLFVNFAWVFFRAGTLADAATMFGKILDKPWFKLHDRFIDAYLIRVLWYPLKLLGVSDVRTGGTVCLWLLLGLSALLVFTAPDTERLTEHFAKTLHYSSETGSISPSRVRVSIGLTAILTAVLFLWCVLSFGEVSSFLYFQF